MKLIALLLLVFAISCNKVDNDYLLGAWTPVEKANLGIWFYTDKVVCLYRDCCNADTYKNCEFTYERREDTIYLKGMETVAYTIDVLNLNRLVLTNQETNLTNHYTRGSQ